MKAKHKKTLLDVQTRPIKSGIIWTDIEKMLKALGADISEGRGSRVRVALNGMRAVFHRPHPQKETNKGAVFAMQRFLKAAEIKHDEI